MPNEAVKSQEDGRDMEGRDVIREKFRPPSPHLLSGRQINWNRIYQFVEVATCGSIKAAAARLQLSPSTLSEHISQLEQELSVKLFVREHRRLRLTAEGARLAVHAKQMFESSKRLIDVVSPIPLGAYPISIGLVPGPLLPLAYGLAGDFLEAFGPLDVKLKHTLADELEDGLLRSRFDFGFSNCASSRKELVSAPVAISSIDFFVAPSLAHRPLATLFAELPLLICDSEPLSRAWVEHVFSELDIEPRAIVNSEHPGALQDLCRRGLGIGVFSSGKSDEFVAQNLARLRLPDEVSRLNETLYVIWAVDSENSAAVQQLKRFIQKRNSRRFN